MIFILFLYLGHHKTEYSRKAIATDRSNLPGSILTGQHIGTLRQLGCINRFNAQFKKCQRSFKNEIHRE